MMRLSSSVAFGALVALSVTACDRDPEKSVLSQPVADTALRPGRLGMPSAALEAIVEARCARSQRCDRIGPGLEYASRDECALRIRAEWSEELNRVDCGLGVDEVALRACLKQLSEQGCRNDVGGACRSIDICERRPERPPVPLRRDLAVPG
jgi:hypothetical protein